MTLQLGLKKTMGAGEGAAEAWSLDPSRLDCQKRSPRTRKEGVGTEVPCKGHNLLNFLSATLLSPYFSTETFTCAMKMTARMRLQDGHPWDVGGGGTRDEAGHGCGLPRLAGGDEGAQDTTFSAFVDLKISVAFFL